MDTTKPETRFALIVDDDPAFRQIAVRSFRRFGLAPLEAQSVRSAGEALGQRLQVIDLLVIDGVLPDGTGLELVEKIRANGVDLPIVYVSAFARKDDALKQKLLGPLRVSAVLSKPIGVVNMLKAFGAALGSSPSREPASQSDEGGMRAMQAVYVKRHALDLWLLTRAVHRMAGPAANSMIARDSLTIAHRLHGSAATYGFPALSSAAKAVEQAFSRVAKDESLIRRIRWEKLSTSLDAAAAELGHFEPSCPPGDSWSGSRRA